MTQEAKAIAGRKLHNEHIGLCGPNIRQARVQGDTWIKQFPGSCEPVVDKAPIAVWKDLWPNRGTSCSVNRVSHLAKEYQIEIQYHNKGIHAIKTHNSLLCLHFSEVLQVAKSLMGATRGRCHFPCCVTPSLLPQNNWQQNGRRQKSATLKWVSLVTLEIF